MLNSVDIFPKPCKICGRSLEPLLLLRMLSNEKKKSKNIPKRKTKKTKANAKLRQGIKVIPIRQSQTPESSPTILLSIIPKPKS